MKHLFKIFATSLCISVALFSEEDISETLFQEEAITNEIALEDINENFSIENLLEQSSQKSESKEESTIIQLDAESLEKDGSPSTLLKSKEFTQNKSNKIAEQENLEVASNDSGLDALLNKLSLEDLIAENTFNNKACKCDPCNCDPCRCKDDDCCKNNTCKCDPCNCNPCKCKDEDCCTTNDKIDPCNLTDGCDSCCKTPGCCTPCDYKVSCVPDTPAYNAPKYLDLACSWDIALSASFIYFQAKEEKLEVGAVSELNTNPLTTTTVTEIGKMSFDYKPAFRVGFEAGYCKDNWNLSLDYFRYHAKVGQASLSKDVAPSSLLIANNYWGGNANTEFDAITSAIDCTSYTASSTWNIDMDLVDVAVARRYFVGQCLTFMPHVGLRFAWIDQKYLASYLCICSLNSTTTTISSTNTTDSFGVGARTGLETNWNFGCGLYFFGNTALSILYTDYDTIKIKLDSSTTTSGNDSPGTASFSTSACYLRPEADIALGLGWGDYFWCGKYYFDLITAYELHVFWDQNMLPANGDFSTIPSALRGNLYLHGLSFTARVDF